MKKAVKKILCIFLWVLLNVFTFIVIMFEQIFYTAIETVITKNIWNVIYIILPIIILIMPCIINHFFKEIKRKFMVSLSIYAIYICTVIIIHITVYNYISVFTPYKWSEYKYERILMLDDLNIKYDFTSISKDDIKSILGEPSAESIDEIEYIVASRWIDPDILVFRFENQKVVEEYIYSEFKSNKLRLYDLS